MPKAVLFDIDGTLLDSNDQHAQCWVDTFAHFGFDIPFERVRSQIGKGGDQLLPALLPEDVVDRQGEAIEDYRKQLFKQTYLDQVRPFEGVRALCERIHASGMLLVLASSGSKEEVEHHIETLGIADLVDHATSADDAERSKPAPDIFAAAMKRIAPLGPDDAIVVGDTPYDAEAAGKAGLRCTGVRCGGFPEEQLRAAGCIAIFDGPQDLLERFGESPLWSGETAVE